MAIQKKELRASAIANRSALVKVAESEANSSPSEHRIVEMSIILVVENKLYHLLLRISCLVGNMHY